MPYIYVSKLNFNSKIFSVYNNELQLKNILNDIINNINENNKYHLKTSVTFEDSRGNQQKKESEETYFFNNLNINKSTRIIKGDIIREYIKFYEHFDKIKNDVVLKSDTVASKIKFYFDVDKEFIGFCTRQKFGYNQFNTAFKGLLECILPEYGFELFLLKDKNKIDNAIKSFDRIDKVIATIIPINPNNDDLEDLLEDSKIFKEGNIKQAKLEYESSKKENGLDMEAGVFNKIIKFARKGYGDLNIHGKFQNHYKIFKSNSDAPMTAYVPENCTDEEFYSETESFFTNINDNDL